MPEQNETSTIEELVTEVEPEAAELPEQFLHVICEQADKGKSIEISRETSGDSFITWDQVKHIAEIASLISTCLTIAKTTADLASLKAKLSPLHAKHPSVDKILTAIRRRRKQ
jgi:hypothetical protein